MSERFQKTLPIRMYSRQRGMCKNVQHHYSLRKHKFKPQWDITTHLLDWLKLKMLTTPNANKDMKQLELLHITTQNVKWHKNSGKQFSIKHTFTIWSTISFQGVYREIKTYSHKNLYL